MKNIIAFLKRKGANWVAPFGIVLLVVFRILGNDKGRLLNDTVRYFNQAFIFPVIDNSVTPIGYPAILSLAYPMNITLIGFSKFLNIALMLFLAYFSFKKKFYHKEIILSLSFISFVSIFSASLTEAGFIVILGLVYYFSSKLLETVRTNYAIMAALILSMFLLYLLRYSALFTFVGFGILVAYQFWKKRQKQILISGFLVLLIVGLMILVYQSYINSQVQYNPQHFIGFHDFSTQLWQIPRAILTEFNPFAHYYFNRLWLTLPIVLGGLVFLIIIFKYIRFKDIKDKDEVLIIYSLAGALCLMASSLIYEMDPLDYRLLGPYTFYIYVVLFRIFKVKDHKKIYHSIFLINTVLIGGFILYTYSSFLDNCNAIRSKMRSYKMENVWYQAQQPTLSDCDILVLCMYPELWKKTDGERVDNKIILNEDDFIPKLNLKDNFVK